MIQRSARTALWAVGCALAMSACGAEGGGGKQSARADAGGAEDAGEDAQTTPPTTDPDSGEPVTAETSLLQGSAQKGPFQNGAMVRIYALDERAQRDGEPTYGQVDAFGRFIVDRLPDDAAWAEVTIEGRSFNEVTGKFAQLQGMHLSMFAPVENGRVRGSINLLTPFAMRRVQRLLSDGDVANITQAREQARAELSELFQTRHHVEQLDLLHADGDETRAPDDSNLLWFSAAFLASDVTGSAYEGMLNDFALDGKIDEPSRVITLQRIQQQASMTLYETAREHLLNTFNSAPPMMRQDPALSWTRYVCVPSVSDDAPKACSGEQTFTLPATSGKGLSLAFVPPDSGSYAISLRQTQRDARHYAEVYSSFGTKLSRPEASDPSRLRTPPLVRGASYTISISPNYADQPNDYVLTLERISDGSARYPLPLLPDVPREGRVGRDMDGVENQYAYYTLATSPREREHFLIFDNLMIAKMRLEIFDVTELPDGELGEDSIFNQVYPSSPHALRIKLPLKPARVYSLRMTVTEVDGQAVGPLSAPMLIGLRLELGP